MSSAAPHYVGVDDRPQSSASIVVVSVAVFAIKALTVIESASACHVIWRPHIDEFGNLTSQWILDQCMTQIKWIDWCVLQPYCKPLVHALEWLY